MKSGLYALAFFALCCTTHKQPEDGKAQIDSLKNNSEDSVTAKPFIKYSNQQLESFLDSIGNLPAQPLMAEVDLKTDSNFRSPVRLNIEISASNFSLLKKAIQSGSIDYNIAVDIFGKDVD